MASSFSKRLGQAPEEGIKAPVEFASSSQIALSGVGTSILLGFAIASGDRILVMGQTSPSENGIYIAQVGAWLRAGDWNANDDVANGQLVLDVNTSTIYQTQFSGSFSIGSTSISFISFQSGLLNVKVVNNNYYAINQSDLGMLILLNAGTDILVDVFAGLGVGFNCEIVQLGVGQVNLIASGAILNSANAQLATRDQYSPISLQCYQNNDFIIGGDLAIGSSASTEASSTLSPLETLNIGDTSVAVVMATGNYYSFNVDPADIDSLIRVDVVSGTNITISIWGVFNGVITDTGLSSTSFPYSFSALIGYSELFVVVKTDDPAHSIEIELVLVVAS